MKKEYIKPFFKEYQITPNTGLLAGSIDVDNTPSTVSADSKKNNMWVFMDDDEE